MSSPLAAALDCVLPGGMGFPSATAIDLARHVSAAAEAATAMEALLAMLPGDFAAQPPSGRTESLAAIERREPDLFAAFVRACYARYYTHPAVVAAVERETGYAARPPLPDGYALPPFDESLLAKSRGRPPHYREA